VELSIEIGNVLSIIQNKYLWTILAGISYFMGGGDVDSLSKGSLLIPEQG